MEVVERAINPDDFQCPPSTVLTDWVNGEIGEFIAAEPDIFSLLVAVLADVIPTFEAFQFLDDSTPQEFGYNGEYTQVMVKTHKDVKRFWDIASDDIQLLALKGTMLQDADRVAATYEAAGLPPSIAAFYASLVHDALAESQILDGGDHPLFSFNAFAFSNPAGSIPDKIVIGDGILAGYEALGFDDVAPQAVYAHEFAHHIQFENGYFADPVPSTDPAGADAAEMTRYTELMADAMSAYYLTHKRGATMNQKRVEQFLRVFFDIGDCAFSNPGHHGTPGQRMAAARFGFDVADEAQKQGHILGAEEFHDRFVARFPELVAPDAPRWRLVRSRGKEERLTLLTVGGSVPASAP